MKIKHNYVEIYVFDIEKESFPSVDEKSDSMSIETEN